VDVEIVDGVSVFLFWSLTNEARQWVETCVSPDRQMYGNGLAVEWRYAAALAEGMQRDGLKVEGVR
jgi:hypothetical protein